MLNNTVFGGVGCREALADALLKLEVDTNWCAGGDECKPWKESEEGKARYEKLKEKVKERQQAGAI